MYFSFVFFFKRGLEYGCRAWIDLSEFSRRKKLCCPDLKSMLSSEKALKSRNGIRYSREKIYKSNSHIWSKNVNDMTHFSLLLTWRQKWVARVRPLCL